MQQKQQMQHANAITICLISICLFSVSAVFRVYSCIFIHFQVLYHILSIFSFHTTVTPSVSVPKQPGHGDTQPVAD